MGIKRLGLISSVLEALIGEIERGWQNRLRNVLIVFVAAAFPFIFIMLFTCVSLFKALRQEK